MTNEQINRAITEARGGCWHEYAGIEFGRSMRYCTKCGTGAKNTDYTTDANACVELWEELAVSGVLVVKYATQSGWYVESHKFRVYEPTFCLAICKAYLKSKGIELENER